MTVLERGAVPAPVLPKETTTVEKLGGDVVVRGLLLSERLHLSALQSNLRTPLPGETEEQARLRAGMVMVPRMLEVSVVLNDGQPVYTAKQWEEFGATNEAEALRLFSIALRLAGRDLEAAAKN